MSEKERDRAFLAELQALPTNDKIMRSIGLIGEWHKHFDGKVYVSLSGGKDSTVLADLCGYWMAAVKQPLNLCFSNTGLEYPEIQKHVEVLREYLADKHHIEVNLDVVRPKINFSEVISTYGYPLISKEVSEAIYYARRIRKPDEHTNRRDALNGTLPPKRERERERRRGDLLNTRDWVDENNSTKKSGVEREKKIYADWGGNSTRELLSGTYTNRLFEYYGGQLRSGVDSVSSLFNKEKWLPVARDLPVSISHLCCNKQKKAPLQEYQKKTGMKPFLGTMAEESRLRRQAWIRHGCNAFDGSKQTSQPLSFWTEQDILRYTLSEKLPLASVYGEIVAVDEFGNEYAPDSLIGDCGTLKCTGCQRTGCVYCAFGAHLEKQGESRFKRLALTHPRQYDYCINGGQWVDNPAYDPTAPKMDGEWQNWNPKKIWVPSKKGLGMGKVFEMLCEIYGKDFIEW